MKKCRRCGVGLAVPDNCNPSQYKNSNYICRSCFSEYGRKQRRKYREISGEGKHCRTCKVVLVLGQNWTENRKNNYALICNDCYRNRQRRYQAERKNDPAKIRKQREYRIKREYGISMEEYESRMSTSDCCEICGFTEGSVSDKEMKRRLVYDHCHDSMDFRGVLCNECNAALGKLGDDIEGLKRAVAYLERSK